MRKTRAGNEKLEEGEEEKEDGIGLSDLGDVSTGHYDSEIVSECISESKSVHLFSHVTPSLPTREELEKKERLRAEEKGESERKNGEREERRERGVHGVHSAVAGVCAPDKREGVYYVIDVARLFPPVAPTQNGVKNSFLFHFLRPEFVRNFPAPLSSDAFSK